MTRQDSTRRDALHTTLGWAAAATLGPTLGACALTGGGFPGGALGGGATGFAAVPPSHADALVLPPGYAAAPLAAWGEPVGVAGAMPAWRPDASNSAAEQALQVGMHHDGLHYLPLDGSRRGLLVIHHPALDEGLLHLRGTLGWSAEKVMKSQAAQGLSVVEVELQGKAWQMVRPSRHARRLTAATPVAFSGPAAGHGLLKTAADASGLRGRGTLGNCGGSLTPWGTVLAGEENFAACFTTADQPTADERRYGLGKSGAFRWHEHDERFDTVRHPHEPHRHGWVLEFDPADAASTPVKRTALGRAAHAGIAVGSTRDGRAVVYCADSGERECIYKFVSRDKIAAPAGGRSAAQVNAGLLDTGTLFVARFEADGSGRWLALVHGQGALTAAAGFADAGALLVKTRQAADAVGGSRLPGLQGLALDARGGWVHALLAGSAASPASFIRWREQGDAAGERLVWNPLWPADKAAAASVARHGEMGAPENLALDDRGVLWVSTGGAAAVPGAPAAPRAAGAPGGRDATRPGNHQLLARAAAGGEWRRFLSAPVHGAVGGTAWTPDGRTMFVNIRHPGSSSRERTDPGNPRRHSNWPDFQPDGRPRSATLAVRRADGGVIGS